MWIALEDMNNKDAQTDIYPTAERKRFEEG